MVFGCSVRLPSPISPLPGAGAAVSPRSLKVIVSVTGTQVDDVLVGRAGSTILVSTHCVLVVTVSDLSELDIGCAGMTVVEGTAEFIGRLVAGSFLRLVVEVPVAIG